MNTDPNATNGYRHPDVRKFGNRLETQPQSKKVPTHSPIWTMMMAVAPKIVTSPLAFSIYSRLRSVSVTHQMSSAAVLATIDNPTLRTPARRLSEANLFRDCVVLPQRLETPRIQGDPIFGLTHAIPILPLERNLKTI
ncbi:MAG TPA: hypothetical protein VGD60_08965 [Candidatus Acidoferrales bacterium]